MECKHTLTTGFSKFHSGILDQGTFAAAETGKRIKQNKLIEVEKPTTLVADDFSLNGSALESLSGN